MISIKSVGALNGSCHRCPSWYFFCIIEPVCAAYGPTLIPVPTIGNFNRLAPVSITRVTPDQKLHNAIANRTFKIVMDRKLTFFIPEYAKSTIFFALI